MATTPSSSRSVTSVYVCDSSPAMMATMPGAIHSVTATPNAISVLRFPKSRPIFSRSAAT